MKITLHIIDLLVLILAFLMVEKGGLWEPAAILLAYLNGAIFAKLYNDK